MPIQVDILGRSIHTIKKNTNALVVASKEIGLEVKADKTKYMVPSSDQNVGQSQKKLSAECLLSFGAESFVF